MIAANHIVYSELMYPHALQGKESTNKDDLPYNYVPTEWVCITFVALFSLSTSKLQVAPDGISFFLLRNEAHSRGMDVS